MQIQAYVITGTVLLKERHYCDCQYCSHEYENKRTDKGPWEIDAESPEAAIHELEEQWKNERTEFQWSVKPYARPLTEEIYMQRSGAQKLFDLPAEGS